MYCISLIPHIPNKFCMTWSHFHSKWGFCLTNQIYHICMYLRGELLVASERDATVQYNDYNNETGGRTGSKTPHKPTSETEFFDTNTSFERSFKSRCHLAEFLVHAWSQSRWLESRSKDVLYLPVDLLIYILRALLQRCDFHATIRGFSVLTSPPPLPKKYVCPSTVI